MVAKFLIISLDTEPSIHTFLAYAAMSSFPDAIIIGLHSLEQFQHYLSDVESQPPNLLLIDSDLSAPGGVNQLLARLRANARLEQTRIILLATALNMHDMVDFYQAGGTLYREKPKALSDWHDLVLTLKTYKA
jgi:DNA-binding response OmpR family regulator